MAANSYVAVGNVEDLSNIITNISPSETPLLSSAGKSKAIGVVHSWLEDALRAPGQNKNAEGAALVASDPTPRAMKYNVTQILEAGYAVTGTQEAVSKHGVKSELGYQMQKAAKELALDHEWALINNTADVMGGTYGGTQGTTANSYSLAGTADDMIRTFAGLPNFIQTNVVAAGGAFTEDQLNSAIQMAWVNGGSPKRAYMSANNKRAASGFSMPDRSVNVEQHDSKLTRVIRFYESDFGVIEMIPHRLMPDNLILIIDPAYVKTADLRPVHRETIAKTTDSVNGVLLGETTLEVRAEKAHAKITGVTVAAPTSAPISPTSFSAPKPPTAGA